jgi:hypothetical protein
LVELTRKRQGQNLYELFGRACPSCGGLGHVAVLPGRDTLQPLATLSGLVRTAAPVPARPEVLPPIPVEVGAGGRRRRGGRGRGGEVPEGAVGQAAEASPPAYLPPRKRPPRALSPAPGAAPSRIWWPCRWKTSKNWFTAGWDSALPSSWIRPPAAKPWWCGSSGPGKTRRPCSSRPASSSPPAGRAAGGGGGGRGATVARRLERPPGSRGGNASSAASRPTPPPSPLPRAWRPCRSRPWRASASRSWSR